MMNSLLNLPGEFQTLATRENGSLARQKLLNILDDHEVVTLDFANSSVSPSFADELVGILARELGFEVFRTKIRMVNVSTPTKAILKHVLSKRLH
ncbi:STAS-like domain-containing protein [Photobacterium atrarenae]|uniref:STAS-like domain-containing protein n=1 Tax=Photobacterium atrarenae TaxID=865757 RepID=A0ABY5GNM4_9GAMM|nr:STAS-like domain-containing protein [Photobacterium atrarenae]UTV30842.1 STAS-like domain-containing protein [Photobacterium atrarenae]